MTTNYQDPLIQVRIGDLPRRGPFRLRGSFIPKQFFYSFLWFLLFGTLTGGFGWYGTVVALQSLETARIWKRGTEAYSLGYRGKVRTTNLVFKNYKLDVSYRTKEGNRYQFHTEFFRFFTGPNKRDPYTIRYLRRDPSKAVMSWAYDALIHGWIFVALLLGMTFLMASCVYIFCVQIIRNALLVRRLAQRGSLVAATIDLIEAATNPQTDKLEYTYHFSFQRETLYRGEHKATDKEEHPIVLGDNEKMVVLIGPSGGDFWVLRHDAYPLILS